MRRKRNLFTSLRHGLLWLGSTALSVVPILAQDGDVTAPTQESLIVSNPIWQADGINTYDITFTASDAGSGVEGMRVIINRQGDNNANRRGFFAWKETGFSWAADKSTDRMPCSGGGFAEKYDWINGSPVGFGRHYSTLLACSTHLKGGQRTVTFTVRPRTDFGSFGHNDVSGWAKDHAGNSTGWLNHDLNFASVSSCGANAVAAGLAGNCDCMRYEAFRIAAGNQPTTHELRVPYVSPVVVCTPSYDPSSEPHVLRIGDVTETSFDIWLQNPLGTPVPEEKVSCLVVEEGAWTCGGARFEARRYLSTQTDGASSWQGEPQSYLQWYEHPVVVGQVMSANDPRWSVFWSRGATAAASPDSQNLYTGKHVGEDRDADRAAEEVGYVVFEAGHTKLKGVEIDATTTQDSHDFADSFVAEPSIQIASLSSMSDPDGGWAVIPGGAASSPSAGSVLVDEDVLADPEREHQAEVVSRLTFFGPAGENPGDQIPDHTCERAYRHEIELIPQSAQQPLADRIYGCAVQEGLDLSACSACFGSGPPTMVCLATCLASQLPDLADCLVATDPPDYASELYTAALDRRDCFCRREGELCSDYYDVVVSSAAGLRSSGPRQRAELSLYCKSDLYMQGPFEEEWSAADLPFGQTVGECAGGTYPADWEVYGGCVLHSLWTLRRCDDVSRGLAPIGSTEFTQLDCGTLDSCATQPPCNSFYTEDRSDPEIICGDGDHSIIGDVVEMATVSSVRFINEVYDGENRPGAVFYEHTFTQTGQSKTFPDVVATGQWVTSKLEVPDRSGACTFTGSGSMYQTSTNVGGDVNRGIDCEAGHDVELSVQGLEGQQTIEAAINFPSTGHQDSRSFANGQTPFSMKFPNGGSYTLTLDNQGTQFACAFDVGGFSLSGTIAGADVVHGVTCSGDTPPGGNYSLYLSALGDGYPNSTPPMRPGGARVNLTLGGGGSRALFVMGPGDHFFDITAEEDESYSLVVAEPDWMPDDGSRISHCNVSPASGTVTGANPVRLSTLNCRNFPGIRDDIFCPQGRPGTPSGILSCTHPLCNVDCDEYQTCEWLDVEADPCRDCRYYPDECLPGPRFGGRFSSTARSGSILVADDYLGLDGTVTDPDGLSSFRVKIDGTVVQDVPVSGTSQAISPLSLDTSGLSAGPHTLSLETSDQGGIVTMASFDFQVDHSGGTGTPPDPPTGVSASDGTFTDRIRVSWNSSAGADTYEVFRSDQNDPQTAGLRQAGITSLSYDDFDVNPGQTFYYWLKARNIDGVSGFSSGNAGSTGTANNHQPDGALDLANCDEIAGWTRDADHTGPIVVDIFRDEPYPTGTLLANVLADEYRGDLQFPDKEHGFVWQVPPGSITDGTPIYVYAHNVDSDGNIGGPNSLLANSGMGLDCPSNPPATNYAEPDGNLDVADCSRIAGWARDADNTEMAVTVALFKNAPYPDGVLLSNVVANLPRPDLPYSDKDHGFDWTPPAGAVSAGTMIYAYAYNIDSNGDVNGVHPLLDPSPVAATCGPSTPPSPPTGVNATDGTFPDKVRMTWNASTGADFYTVWRHSSNNSGGAVQKVTTTSTSWNDTSVGTGVYYYWVRAHNAAGASAFSAVDSGYVQLPDPPEAPTGLDASDGASMDHVRLTWNASAGADTYSVWRHTSNNTGAATRIRNGLTATTHDDTTAEPGVTYWYWVKAHNEGGDSPFSAGDQGTRREDIVLP